MKLEPEKILHRAEQRLGELPQASDEETLRLLRSFLRMESHRLRMLHRFGLGGLEVARARSQVVDVGSGRRIGSLLVGTDIVDAEIVGDDDQDVVLLATKLGGWQ